MNSFVQPSSSAAIDEAISHVAATMKPSHSDQIDELLGKLENNDWRQLYETGEKSLKAHKLELAEHQLLDAVKAAKHGISNTRKLVWSRNALADVLYQENRLNEALKLYEWSANNARRSMGESSEAEARAQLGLAKIYLLKRKLPQAQDLCKQAILAFKQNAGSGNLEYGDSLITMGCILSGSGRVEQADTFFTAGLQKLQGTTKDEQLDVSDALHMVALAKEATANRSQAQQLFEQSYAIKDRFVVYDQTPQLKGQIKYAWEPGSPRSQEIPDPVVPVRYVCADNVRVACTIVDLWELFGLLISITNVGEQRVELGLGKVSLMRTTGDPLDPQGEKLEFVDSRRIDRVRREQDIWRLTSTRPWLANMQKTRNIRGLVPAKGHDLFRGPNVFGVYGEWAASNRVLPEKFQLHPSPERVEYQAQVVVDPSLVRSNKTEALGLTPVSLEPFESRTGELFYMNPRCEHLLLRVPVGNAIFEFPFVMPKRRTNT